MRILIVYSIADLYGASRSLLRLSSRLVKDGHKIKIVLGEDGPLTEELKKANVDYIVQSNLLTVNRTELKKPLEILKFILKFPASIISFMRVIRKFKPELVHTNASLTITSPIASKISGVPHIWHIRESFLEFGFLWKFYQRFMLFFSTRIISVSTPIADQFSRNKKKIEVLHNGFPAEEFNKVAVSRIEAIKEKYQLKEGINVGVVGRIRLKRKGQEVFVRSIKEIKNRGSANFLIIGSPYPGNESHLEELESIIDSNGLKDEVILTGDIEDIKAAFSLLDILILPSGLPEPFGGVVVEAMAFGKPVIGTNIGGTTEQVKDGVTGILIPPDDPSALSKAIEKLIEDDELRNEMGKEGQQRFLQNFEFEAFYSKIVHTYESLIR